MTSTSKNPFWKALALGTLAGMRTSSAPIVANRLLSQHPGKRHSHYFKWLASNEAGVVFGVMGAGEFVGDKLPKTPARIAPQGLIGRCISGALAGGAIYEAAGDNALLGALIGSAAASCSTFVTYFARKKAGSITGVPDPFIGGIGDFFNCNIRWGSAHQ